MLKMDFVLIFISRKLVFGVAMYEASDLKKVRELFILADHYIKSHDYTLPLKKYYNNNSIYHRL